MDKGDLMDCPECKKRIKDFLNDSLNTKNCVEFVEHVKGCNECMEELSIEFLVTEGLKRLDNATSFDLESELNEKIEKSYNKAKFYKKFMVLSLIAVTISAFLLGLLLSTFFAY